METRTNKTQPEAESVPYPLLDTQGSFGATNHVSQRHLDDATVTDATLELDRTLQQAPISVPGSDRRGLFASLTILAEIDDPYLYPQRIKWFITFVVAFAAAATSLGSAIIYPALVEIARDLNASATVTSLTVALYMLSISVFPLWWSNFSEGAGRRTTYITSIAFFVLFAILSSIANSISVFIAMRMLSGGAGASVQAVGAGTLADIWEPLERGKAMGRFYIGPLCGPLLAPIIGGFLTAHWGWRSTQWFLVIYGVVTFILIVFSLPETTKPRQIRNFPTISHEEDETSQTKIGTRFHTWVARFQTKKIVGRLQQVFLDPLKIALLLRHLPILFTAYYAALAFGTLYIVNISVQDVFAKPPYNFSITKIGLIYIPSGFGFLISALFSGKWADYVMAREARRKSRYDENNELIFLPEERMRENAWVAAVAFPMSLIWYGWSADRGTFWVIPMLATLIFGLSAMLIFGLAVTMLTEFTPRKPSNGVAVANFLRNIFSCVGTVLGDPLIRAEGNGWTFTGLAVLASTGALVIWWMIVRGEAWRTANQGKIG